MENIIEAKSLYKIYDVGQTKINALNDASFTIRKGELTVILGPSGAGKTTLLNILGGMDNATSGQLLVEGEDIVTFDNKKLTDYRRNKIGFVFQFYNLVPDLTALENIEVVSDKIFGWYFG